MTEQMMRDHWWWRPGWRVGRRMYTWHFTFDGQEELHTLVDAYQARLAGLSGLDPIPRQWLHLTTQGLGFVDETPAADVEAVIHASRARLAGLPRVDVTVGPAVIDPEVVRLRVQPGDALAPVRRALREAIVEARDPEQLMEAEGWEPHISVAYSSAAGPMKPIAATLEPALDPAPVQISEVQLIVLNRDDKQYEWETRAAIPLGGLDTVRAHARNCRGDPHRRFKTRFSCRRG